MLQVEGKDLQRTFKSLGLITAKKVLYVMNVDESDPLGTGPLARRVLAHAESEGMEAVAVCAKIESELAELEGAERQEMLEALGFSEPALDKLARAAYHLLGLQSFYTAGPKEIRAWTIPVGCKAPQAAGVIHTDFERGFIRVEVYSVDDLDQFRSEKAIRDAGKMRTEGKEYVMHDADVCHFLFNV
jgi:ribosome-binding ATPase YchF (GTP1/OBG family)